RNVTGVQTCALPISINPINPYDVGMTGLIGFASGYHAMRECDLLLMLGTNFPYRAFYPEHGNIVQIDIRSHHLGRRSPLTMGLRSEERRVGEAERGR